MLDPRRCEFIALVGGGGQRHRHVETVYRPLRCGRHRRRRVITSGCSVRGQVGIAQDIGLTLQILQTVLDYVTDADDAGELAVAQHRHVAHAMASHQ
jgi:hypothetical protein